MLYQSETLQLHWLENGIAELVFDAPGSVNKLDTKTVANLGEALNVLEKQSELKGLLLRSAKTALIVGADITEFLSLFNAPPENCTSGWCSPTPFSIDWKIYPCQPFQQLMDTH